MCYGRGPLFGALRTSGSRPLIACSCPKAVAGRRHWNVPWGRADISLSDDMKNDLPDDISKPPHYADVEGFGLGVGAMTTYDGCIKPVGS
jgi:hypothetical protein